MQVYGPMWFLIKQKPGIIYAPRYLFKYTQLIEWLPAQYKKIVQNAFSRNSFNLHPANMLMSMICDDQFDVRKTAVDIILKTRTNDVVGVRKFQLPSINFKAKIYYDMIDFEQENIFITSCL